MPFCQLPYVFPEFFSHCKIFVAQNFLDWDKIVSYPLIMKLLIFHLVLQILISLVVFLVVPLGIYFGGMIAMGVAVYFKSQENAKTKDVSIIQHTGLILVSAILFPGKILQLILN